MAKLHNIEDAGLGYIMWNTRNPAKQQTEVILHDMKLLSSDLSSLLEALHETQSGRQKDDEVN